MDAKSKVSYKLLIDKTRNKVLFAEAGKDFVDFLFNLMSIPIGTVTRLLAKNSMLGILGNLYGSIENLNNNYLQTEETKESLLKPKLPSAALEVSLLLPNNDAKHESKKLYQCSKLAGTATSDGGGFAKPKSKKLYQCEKAAATSDGGGFVKGIVTFMVTDDLVVTPSGAISSITKVINEVVFKDLKRLKRESCLSGDGSGVATLIEFLGGN